MKNQHQFLSNNTSELYLYEPRKVLQQQHGGLEIEGVGASQIMRLSQGNNNFLTSARYGSSAFYQQDTLGGTIMPSPGALSPSTMKGANRYRQ